MGRWAIPTELWYWTLAWESGASPITSGPSSLMVGRLDPIGVEGALVRSIISRFGLLSRISCRETNLKGSDLARPLPLWLRPLWNRPVRELPLLFDPCFERAGGCSSVSIGGDRCRFGTGEEQDEACGGVEGLGLTQSSKWKNIDCLSFLVSPESDIPASVIKSSPLTM